MLRDEFDRIIELFAQSAEGKPVQLEELFGQCTQFFDQLKQVLREGSSEEKQEALKLMGEMHTKMMGEIKKVSEKTGLTEEQLMAVAENPRNFSQEQWRSIQEAKGKISEAGSDLVQILRKGETGSAPSSAPAALPKKASGVPLKKKEGPKSQKKGWLKT